jgi:hypothetical protein
MPRLLKTEVLGYLQRQPMFRERKNKDRGIVNLLMEKYPPLKILIENGILKKEDVVAMFQDYSSMDRAWRKSLQDHEELRGTDYDEKTKLESEMMEELGYPDTKNI